MHEQKVIANRKVEQQQAVIAFYKKQNVKQKKEQAERLNRIHELEKQVEALEVKNRNLNKVVSDNKRQVINLHKQDNLQPFKKAKSIRTLNVKATAYTSSDEENGGRYNGKVLTATGVDVTHTIYYKGYRILAVDKRLIPLYSVVEVSIPNQKPFKAMAMDVGGAIKGNRVDILYPNRKEAFKFGRRDITLKILGKSR
jgi:3D (Asp-Asp-Asp) domain-containing protein